MTSVRARDTQQSLDSAGDPRRCPGLPCSTPLAGSQCCCFERETARKMVARIRLFAGTQVKTLCREPSGGQSHVHHICTMQPALYEVSCRSHALLQDAADVVVQNGHMDDCATCDTAGVPSAGSLPWDIDATTKALIQRVRAGRMRELRHDVPLDDMVALLESDQHYTISSFMECLDCGRVLAWQLCIRGNPILRHADVEEVDRWRWSPVPPRERWARR